MEELAMNNRFLRRIMAALFFLFVLTVSAAALEPVSVVVDGTPVVWTDATPVVEGGRTLVPLRAAAEAMGLTVSWDNTRRTAIFSADYTEQTSPEVNEDAAGGCAYLDSTRVEMPAGSQNYTVYRRYALQDASGGVKTLKEESALYQMDTAVVLRGGRTLAPVRYVAENFGFDVTWDAETRTVGIGQAQPVGWHFAAVTYGETGDEFMTLALYDSTNVASGEITALTVKDDQGKSKTVKLEEASAAELQMVYDYRSEARDGVFAAVTFAYAFQPGVQYTVDYTVSVHKQNTATALYQDGFSISF